MKNVVISLVIWVLIGVLGYIVYHELSTPSRNFPPRGDFMRPWDFGSGEMQRWPRNLDDNTMSGEIQTPLPIESQDLNTSNESSTNQR